MPCRSLQVSCLLFVVASNGQNGSSNAHYLYSKQKATMSSTNVVFLVLFSCFCCRSIAVMLSLSEVTHFQICGFSINLNNPLDHHVYNPDPMHSRSAFNAFASG
uniref:AlNc14C174G8086 protein n=1 Tax=Albugo laibachii Nc14 TaxID=890382 RepID=F0WNS7_9STRA|nr:AlNc14C174G8086 [Albugo laibachii Nc14]|eukprot:CCA22969.1 AlNc14C174G8086 [Albugo laibachii Nc14]